MFLKTFLLLFLAAFLVYGPSLLNGFVWDDTALVLKDPLIRSWRLIPEGFRHFLFTDATASNFYRPLQRLSFTCDYLLWGFRPLFYHLSNIILHALAGCALFGLLFELTKKRLLASVVALIWVIHPINSSAVIYVAGRADCLAALFGFAGLWLGLKNRNGWAPACLFLALLSKESAFAFVLIWLGMMIWKRQSLLVGILLLQIVLCNYGVLRLSAEHRAPPRFTEPAPWVARPILFARATALYAGLFLFPANLTMERDLMALQPGVDADGARDLEYLTLAGVALLMGGIFYIGGLGRSQNSEGKSATVTDRRHRGHAHVWFCAASAWVAYLPISNLFPLNATFAEHWFYIPGAFLLAAMALSLEGKFSRWPRWAQLVAVALLGFWMAGLGARTFIRNADWRDAKTFFTRTILNGGASSRMWSNLGGIELKEGKPEAALACFKKARQLSSQPFALLGLGSAEIKLGDYKAARAHLEEAFKNPFVRPEALVNLAVLDHLESGRDRIEYLWEAASMGPANWDIQKRYLLHLAEIGQESAAVRELKTLLETEWWRAESWRVLGDLLTKQDQAKDAADAYREAAKLDVHLAR